MLRRRLAHAQAAAAAAEQRRKQVRLLDRVARGAPEAALEASALTTSSEGVAALPTPTCGSAGTCSREVSLEKLNFSFMRPPLTSSACSVSRPFWRSSHRAISLGVVLLELGCSGAVSSSFCFMVSASVAWRGGALRRLLPQALDALGRHVRDGGERALRGDVGLLVVRRGPVAERRHVVLGEARVVRVDLLVDKLVHEELGVVLPRRDSGRAPWPRTRSCAHWPRPRPRSCRRARASGARPASSRFCSAATWWWTRSRLRHSWVRCVRERRVRFTTLGGRVAISF